MDQFDLDRRKWQRRREISDEAVRQLEDRRVADRRRGERRQYARVAYPLMTAPQILNMQALVISLSAKAVRFFFSAFDPQESSLEQGGKVELILKFHDGQVIETRGTILRKVRYRQDKEYFVCLFDKELPRVLIEKERAYLQKKFLGVSSEEL